jgi:hypothetical protein
MLGVLALGGEAGSWYVTQEHAQTAADAAAVAGAWRLVWNASDSVAVAQNFAAQNGFCNGCTPLDATQSVSVVSSATTVQVTVSQQQPTYLARVLLRSSTINIPAQATAVVDTLPAPPCILALTGSVSFQGSATVNSPTCGVASDSTASNAINFTGNGGTINAPSFTQGGCADTGGNQCSYTGNNKVSTYGPPVPNPLSGLDSAMSSLTTSNFSGGQCSSLTASTSCYNGDSKKGFTFSAPSYSLNGSYFFTGPVTIGGNVTITGTATLILFGPTASLTINGNPSIQLTAQTTPQVPSALSSVQSLMTDLLIYDPETTNKNQTVNVSGDSNSFFNGIVYAPNASVQYTGNSNVTSPSCFVVIASAVTFSGNTNIDDRKCISDGAPGTPQPKYVRLLS